MTYDLIIIGAGPAGVSAALYSARQKLNILLLSRDMGGQIGKKSVDIENYPGFEKISGSELIEKFVSHLEKQESVEIKFTQVEKIEKEKDIFIF